MNQKNAPIQLNNDILQLNQKQFENLSAQLRIIFPEEVNTTLQDIRRKRSHLRTLFEGNTLLGFIVFQKEQEGNAFISVYWGKPIQKKFVRSYNVTPARYLLEELVREGITTMHATEKREDIARVIETFKKKKFIEAKQAGRLSFTSSFIKHAKTRRRV